MSSQHDLKKHQIAVKFDHHVWRQIEKKAKERNESPSDTIRTAVYNYVYTVELTAEDAQIIADRIHEAEVRGKMI